MRARMWFRWIERSLGDAIWVTIEVLCLLATLATKLISWHPIKWITFFPLFLHFLFYCFSRFLYIIYKNTHLLTRFWKARCHRQCIEFWPLWCLDTCNVCVNNVEPVCLMISLSGSNETSIWRSSGITLWCVVRCSWPVFLWRIVPARQITTLLRRPWPELGHTFIRKRERLVNCASRPRGCYLLHFPACHSTD